MLEEKIKSALEGVRPHLVSEGGDVEFVSLSPEGVVAVKMKGACSNCPGAEMTLKLRIEAHVKKEVPEVSSVVRV